MRFFSRVVFICNCCFVLAVILNFVEQAHKKNGNFNGAIQIRPLVSMLVILGYGAIIVNFILNIFMLVLFVTEQQQNVTTWLIWVNFFFLLVQIFYHFIL